MRRLRKIGLFIITPVFFCLFGAFSVPAQENRTFRDAIYKGDLSAVKQYVNQGADVNHLVNTPWTPLLCAAVPGHLEVFNYLLSKGANVFAIDETGKSLLMWAAQAGRVEVVQTLLARQVPVNLRDKRGNTALTWACAWKDDLRNDAADELHGKAAAFLLAAGSEVNPTNTQGRTPLMLAAKGGSAACVRALLNRQAEVDLSARDGNTALLFACDYGYAEAVELLVSHQANVNAANRKGVSPLMLAAENGDARSVRLLLSRGADVRRADRAGRTVSDYALAVNVGALLQAAGVHFTQPQPQEGKPDTAAASSLDYALYDLILADLRRVGEFDPWQWSQEKGGLGPRVNTQTTTPLMCSDYKMNIKLFKQDVVELMKQDIELDRRSQYKARTDILEDIGRRNTNPVALNGYRPKFEAHAERPKENRIDKAVFKCLLYFALPGYSTDGNTAYVFFEFIDGGMHGGGRGIYCLQKQEGAWQVAWKRIILYV